MLGTYYAKATFPILLFQVLNTKEFLPQHNPFPLVERDMAAKTNTLHCCCTADNVRSLRVSQLTLTK